MKKLKLSEGQAKSQYISKILTGNKKCQYIYIRIKFQIAINHSTLYSIYSLSKKGSFSVRQI